MGWFASRKKIDMNIYENNLQIARTVIEFGHVQDMALEVIAKSRVKDWPEEAVISQLKDALALARNTADELALVIDERENG